MRRSWLKMGSKYTEEMALIGENAVPMTFYEYQLQARRTAGTHENDREAILNWTLGLTGEGGEFANLIKKSVFHGHGFDYEEIISELGDCLWYLSQLCTSLGLNMNMVAAKNLRKLA